MKEAENKKLIKLVVSFLTTDLEIKKQCWSLGTVHATANRLHRIRSENTEMSFASLDDITEAIKQTVKKANIVVIDSKAYKETGKKIIVD